LKERKTTRVLAVPGDTLAAEGIAGALRGLPFQPGLRFPAHFLTNEPKLYNVTLEFRGRETIRIAPGTVDCYKVELVPHLGALDAFRFLYPKAYFWFAVESPHGLVRYQGLESGPGGPDVIIERLSVQ
jgi:hypothetical protein